MIGLRAAVAALTATFLFLAALALMPAPPVALAQAPTFTPSDEIPEDYPAGRGRDETFYTCTGCHNFKLVAQQGQSRQQWEETLEWMSARFNMPRLEGELRNTVLDYLAATYPPRRSPGGWRNPFEPR